MQSSESVKRPSRLVRNPPPLPWLMDSSAVSVVAGARHRDGKRAPAAGDSREEP